MDVDRNSYESSNSQQSILQDAWFKLFEAKHSATPKAWKSALENIFSFGCNDYGELATEKLVKGFKLIGVELTDEEEEAFLESFQEEESFTLEEFVNEMKKHEIKEEEKRIDKGGVNILGGYSGNKFSNVSVEHEAISRLVWTKMVGVAENESYKFQRALKMLFVSQESESDEHAGCISTQDMCDGLMWFDLEMTPEQMIVFREDLDIKGNGMISYEGFKKLVNEKAKRLKAIQTPIKMKTSMNVLNAASSSSSSGQQVKSRVLVSDKGGGRAGGARISRQKPSTTVQQKMTTLDEDKGWSSSSVETSTRRTTSRAVKIHSNDSSRSRSPPSPVPPNVAPPIKSNGRTYSLARSPSFESLISQSDNVFSPEARKIRNSRCSENGESLSSYNTESTHSVAGQVKSPFAKEQRTSQGKRATNNYNSTSTDINNGTSTTTTMMQRKVKLSEGGTKKRLTHVPPVTKRRPGDVAPPPVATQSRLPPSKNVGSNTLVRDRKLGDINSGPRRKPGRVL